MNKALIILSLFMCIKLSAQSQIESLTIFDKHNEVRIGVIKILAGPIFEGTYEYVKNRNVGYGASLLVNFNSENDYFENLSVTPFFACILTVTNNMAQKAFL